MLAMFRDAARVSMQHRVGRRRAIARNNFERSIAIRADLQVVENVEQLRIDQMALAGAKIPQQIVDVVQAGGVVGATIEVGCRQRLSGMGMNETQTARPGGSG